MFFGGVWDIWASSVLVRSASDGVPQGSVVGPLYFANLRNTLLVCRLWASSVPWTPEATVFSSPCSPPNYSPQLRTPHPPPQHNTHTYTQLSEGEAGGGIRSFLVVPDRKDTQSACVTLCACLLAIFQRKTSCKEDEGVALGKKVWMREIKIQRARKWKRARP